MTKGTGPEAVSASVCTHTVLKHQNIHSKPQTQAYVENAENAVACEFNIAVYVQNLPEHVRNKIAGFLRTGNIDQDQIDIENIEHYLIVSRYSSPLKSICEAKLLSTLNFENCFMYLVISERFDLTYLKLCSKQLCDNFNTQREGVVKPDLSDQQNEESQNSRDKTYTSYNTLFTCNTTGSGKKSLTALVLNSKNDVKCYRTLQKGKKISKNFQCCCLQDHEAEPPYMMYSFGKCFWMYDPVLNKCKKLPSMRFPRSNFSLVAHNKKCYVIGGEKKGKNVKTIEVYNPIKKSWKNLVELPTENMVTSISTVSLENNIYIFCSEKSENDINSNKLSAYLFDTKQNILYKANDIQLSFSQVKACAREGLIYLACDSGDFLAFNPRTHNFGSCREQIIKCRDFGMFTDGSDIFIVGGINSEEKCNNIIRQFCPSNRSWVKLSKTIPDCMPVYGMCEVKVPNSYSIVPFYESKFFEKQLNV